MVYIQPNTMISSLIVVPKLEIPPTFPQKSLTACQASEDRIHQPNCKINQPQAINERFLCKLLNGCCSILNSICMMATEVTSIGVGLVGGGGGKCSQSHEYPTDSDKGKQFVYFTKFSLSIHDQCYIFSALRTLGHSLLY